MKRYFILSFLLVAIISIEQILAQNALSVNNQSQSGRKLIFKALFNRPLDTTLWHIELERSPGSFVGVANDKLVLKTGAGVTVWLKKKLKGNLIIEYDRKVIMEGGPFDRLSDLNQFWMAADPHKSVFFTRSGKLDEYNNLQLYYVGMGGNGNTTTRFRKYDGLGNRILISEYTDQQHLLEANITYHIKIIIENGNISYEVNHQLYFAFNDPDPLTEGFLGFRSTKSNQEISNLKVYQLP
ncbi:rhamnogalacturonan endolyase [Mucilaginibacter mallensis]|uniref:Rhamnogalacturonan endolyase n=1 Tax=Mucilaginibacter mallensis TaxID=652787 RepID=A0A1H1MMZ4_MUCMA|nr:DUF6250 domain-containing protein [Mucilaginibacter mallensis]SDR88116.1 rhamnogalacturonan endolyase [Mucilaginibacter mallensis]